MDTSRCVSQLTVNSSYWWRVKAKNITGWGPFSAAWKFTLYLNAITKTDDLDIEFRLSQNYPNPFNPRTVISYTIGANHDSPVQVDLSVYNIRGQKAATLVSGKQPAGTYNVEWNAMELASGIYFYRLSTGSGFVQTRKMVVVR